MIYNCVGVAFGVQVGAAFGVASYHFELENNSSLDRNEYTQKKNDDPSVVSIVYTF